MAERRFMFMSPEGFADSASPSDSTTLGSLLVDTGGKAVNIVDGKVVAEYGGEFGINAPAGLTTVHHKLLVKGQADFEDNVQIINRTLVLTGRTSKIEAGGDISAVGDVWVGGALKTGGAVEVGGPITGLPNLTGASLGSSATNKNYVDTLFASVTSGVSLKTECRIRVNDAALNLASPGASLDGRTMQVGDRILVTGKGKDNGIYVWNGATSAMTRASDADSPDELRPGIMVVVTEGSSADTAWMLVTDGPITIGTTVLDFNLYASVEKLTAGNGLSKPDATTIAVNAVAPIKADGTGTWLDHDSTNSFKIVSPGRLHVRTLTATGLQLAGSSVGVKLATNSGLGFKTDDAAGNDGPTNGLRVVGDNNNGVEVLSTGVAVKLQTSNSGLGLGSGLRVVADAAKGTEVGSTGIGVKLAGTNPGLGFDTAAGVNNGVKVLANTAGGMVADANGVKPNLGDTLTIASNKIQAKEYLAGGLSINSGGFGLQINMFDPAGQTLEVSNSYTHVRPGKGLMKDADGVGVKVVSTNRLSADATNGLDVVGVPSLFKINGTAVGSTVTAANLNTLTAGAASNADALHTHAAANQTKAVANLYAVANGVTVTAGDTVYISASGVVSRTDASVDSTCFPIGVAKTTVTGNAGLTNKVEVVSDGPVTLSSLTAGARYYVKAGGGLSAANTMPGAGKRVIFIGTAVSATELYVRFQDYGRQAV